MWTDTQKRIFGPYNDGKQQAYADPLAVDRKLKRALGGDVNRFLERYNSEADVERMDATESLVKAAIDAFEMKPLDRTTGEGVTESEAIGVLFDYCDWLEKKNLTGSTSPTSPPCSVVSSLPPCPTPISSACG